MNHVKDFRIEDAAVSLFEPLGLWPFINESKNEEPCLIPGVALPLGPFFDWRMIRAILPNHSNCWLLRNGKMPPKFELCQGSLSFSQVLKKFGLGYSLVIREAELAHIQVTSLARQIEDVFRSSVKIQLHANPPYFLSEDWQYAERDIFILQNSGSEELYVYKNKGSGTGCILKAGDGFFIPEGFCYRSQAQDISFQVRISHHALRRQPSRYEI